MNPNEWTDLLKAVNDLKSTSLAIVSSIMIMWLVITLFRAWWSHAEEKTKQDRISVEKAESLRREEEREERLGSRLDAINDRTLTIYETTIKSNTQVLAKVSQVLERQAAIIEHEIKK